MKKYLLGIFAVVLAIGFSAFTKESSKKKVTAEHAYAHWYTVVSGKVGTEVTAYQNFTKSSVISVDPCKDDVLPLCLIGSDDELQAEDDIPAATTEPGNPSNTMNRIKEVD